MYSSRVLAMPFSFWFWVGFFSFMEGIPLTHLFRPTQWILFIGLASMSVGDVF